MIFIEALTKGFRFVHVAEDKAKAISGIKLAMRMHCQRQQIAYDKDYWETICSRATIIDFGDGPAPVLRQSFESKEYQAIAVHEGTQAHAKELNKIELRGGSLTSSQRIVVKRVELEKGLIKDRVLAVDRGHGKLFFLSINPHDGVVQTIECVSEGDLVALPITETNPNHLARMTMHLIRTEKPSTIYLYNFGGTHQAICGRQ